MAGEEIECSVGDVRRRSLTHHGQQSEQGEGSRNIGEVDSLTGPINVTVVVTKGTCKQIELERFPLGGKRRAKSKLLSTWPMDYLLISLPLAR